MKEQANRQPKHRPALRAACALSCLAAIASLSWSNALAADSDPKPDSPKSVAALKELGAEFKLNESHSQKMEQTSYFRQSPYD